MPLQTPGDHQMQYQPAVVVEAYGNALADASQGDDDMVFDRRYRRIDAAYQERITDPDRLQTVTVDPRGCRVDIEIYVREFRHVWIRRTGPPGRRRPCRRCRSSRRGSWRGTAGDSPRRSRTFERRDLGADRPMPCGVETLLIGACAARATRRLLRHRVDSRPVLRADVVALTHPLRGIVRFPEDREQRS